jgi:hypothetical protein
MNELLHMHMRRGKVDGPVFDLLVFVHTEEHRLEQALCFSCVGLVTCNELKHDAGFT